MIAMVAKALAVLAATTGTIETRWVLPHPAKHRHHRKPRRPDPPMSTAVASWYAEHGTGACGVGDVQAGYRIANRTLRCGTRVLICYRRCVLTVVSDRGPFVYSRLFDLNANTRWATGCPDLCTVRWRLA